MDTFDLKETANQILDLMANAGANAKKLKIYRETGFGTAIRYFTAKDITEASAAMIDNFLFDQRVLYESGAFSEWKWQLVRRSCELLKHFKITGSIDLPELRPWDSALGRPRQSLLFDSPTPEQLAIPDDLFTMIWRVKQALFNAGLKARTIEHYIAEGMSIIFRRHLAHGLTCYSAEITDEVIAETRNKYEQHLISRASYQNIRKAGFLLATLHETGNITLGKLPNWGQREPNPQFALLLSHFCNNAIHSGILARTTVNTARSAIRIFLFELEDTGRCSFDGVTLAEVSAAISHMATRYNGGLHTAMFSVRVFLLHLYENDFTQENLSFAIPEMVARRTTFHEVFKDTEIMQLLDEADLTTPIGKRDYSMMCLAAQAGLRACDIVNLKRKDIDWRTMEIRIVQRKTGKPLALPLEVESGNAIADYLLHVHPESDLPYVFLCHTGFLRPLNSRSASAVVTRYMRRAKIDSSIPRRGFHSFRRSFGTRLLQNEVPLDLLRQLLGHSKIDSAKPYLSVDEQGLKSCALGLVRSEKDSEPV